jgi:hypothetical protein
MPDTLCKTSSSDFSRLAQFFCAACLSLSRSSFIVLKASTIASTRCLNSVLIKYRYSPQNWIKAKTCLAGINFAIRNYFNILPLMPQGGKEMKARLDAALSLGTEDFEYRWAAD